MLAEAARHPKDFGSLELGLSEDWEAREHKYGVQFHYGGPALTAGGFDDSLIFKYQATTFLVAYHLILPVVVFCWPEAKAISDYLLRANATATLAVVARREGKPVLTLSCDGSAQQSSDDATSGWAFTVDAAAREGLPAWGRLLGLLLAAPWRADGQLGSLVALVAGPLAARAALRVGLEPAAMGAAKAGATTDDLLALLRTARLSGLCRAAGAADERALEEVDGALRAALEGGLDATAVVPHLAALAPGEPIGRRLAKGARSRAAAAALVLAAMRLPAAGLPTADLARLAGLAGLPAGHGEGGGRTDQRAAAARARGELFFEDVEGAGAAAGGASDSEGIGPDSAAAALEAVRSGALERLEGVEAIEGAEDGEPGGKKRARQPPGAEEDEGADGDDAGAAAVGSTPVKRRLRKKKKAVDDA
ncbi:unnamed protein product [Prorocentrum cordatum]|uniref:FACT complex subunit n=1 Tax=Prorocentrum cordatum TaxID=2364126 RepID=A0ABN9Y9Z1_9DINO|nr:unnamed protein product [Polarella glacialis]